MVKITENDIELYAIEELERLGFEYRYGINISPEGNSPEREEFSDVLLIDRLRKAVAKLNPSIPADAQEQAVQKIARIYSPDLLHNNEAFHKFLVEKVPIPYNDGGFERSHYIGPSFK